MPSGTVVANSIDKMIMNLERSSFSGAMFHVVAISLDVLKGIEQLADGQFLQGVSVAASPVLATIGMSVCLSVRLSVTPWH